MLRINFRARNGRNNLLQRKWNEMSQYFQQKVQRSYERVGIQLSEKSSSVRKVTSQSNENWSPERKRFCGKVKAPLLKGS